MLSYHLTVTSSLQAVIRLARSSPLVATIEAPIAKAEAIAQRQVRRYVSITQTHGTRTALRKVQVPAIQMVILAPKTTAVTIVLMSNIEPPGSRETWVEALGQDDPLTWRNYTLALTLKGRVTWRLSEVAREQYRARIARLITGRGGMVTSGEQPYQLSAESAHTQVLGLAAHLGHYPGLSGIRSDVYDLAQYSIRVWRSTHPDVPFPLWPRMPTLPYLQPRTAPLSTLRQSVQEPADAQEEQ